MKFNCKLSNAFIRVFTTYIVYKKLLFESTHNLFIFKVLMLEVGEKFAFEYTEK